MASSNQTMSAAALAVVLLGSAGCEAERLTPPSASDRPPQLSLIATARGVVELRIAGPTGLRALQGKLSYDSKVVRVTTIAPGADVARMDRVFYADPAKASGRIVLGIADTRRVRLPARGTLFRIRLQGTSGDKGSASVSFGEALGAGDGATRVDLQRARVDVVLP